MGQVSAGSASLLRRVSRLAVLTYLAVLLVADPAALGTEDAGGAAGFVWNFIGGGGRSCRLNLAPVESGDLRHGNGAGLVRPTNGLRAVSRPCPEGLGGAENESGQFLITPQRHAF